MRVLIEQADFSQKKKPETAVEKKCIPAINTSLPPEIALKKQAEKKQFEADLENAKTLLLTHPSLQQDILDLINRIEQTAYTKENIEDFPFLKSKIIFRLKQQFPESFRLL